MANRLRGEASFTHEGRTLTIALNAEAFLQVEDETGLGLFDLLTTGQRSLSGMASLLRAGLKQGCGIEIDRVGAADMMLAAPAAGQALRAALTAALPDAEPEILADPPKAVRKRGAGKIS